MSLTPDQVRLGQPIHLLAVVDRKLAGADQGIEGVVVRVANPVAVARADREHMVTVGYDSLVAAPTIDEALTADAARTVAERLATEVWPVLQEHYPDRVAEADGAVIGWTLDLVLALLAEHRDALSRACGDDAEMAARYLDSARG